MKEERRIVVGALVVCFAAILFGAAILGCESKPASLAVPRVGFSISTVEHDGHKFIVARYSHGICIILHPDDGKK